jgi:hypothetical protein
MTRPMTRLAVLALVSVIGIVGMLLADGAADWFFLALAGLPLLLGGVAMALRRPETGNRERSAARSEVE